ncbi:MAG TPA: hypothetical protein VGQ76_22490 [Thermoanaerobaculia bacterium]|jgi:hypothetical protein|nr:hypothetical protein [Thermoanaerobaculia bacterium]
MKHLRCIAETRDRHYEMTSIDELRFVFRWIEKGERLTVRHVVREMKGVERLLFRMLGLKTVVECMGSMLIHHELDLAALLFIDEEGHEMRALGHYDAGDSRRIRFRLKKGGYADHLAAECVSLDTAFRAIEAQYLEGNPPDWLTYRNDARPWPVRAT